MKANKGIEEAIRIAGSQSALASMLELNQSTISKYLCGALPVPIRFAIRMQKDMRFKLAKELFRPDVFGGE